MAAAFACEVTGARFLLRAKPRHDVMGLARLGDLMNRTLDGYGYGQNLVSTIETDDPDVLASALKGFASGAPSPNPASFLSSGAKRGLLEPKVSARFMKPRRRLSRSWRLVLVRPSAVSRSTPRNAHSASLASACPANALSDNPERPSRASPKASACNAASAPQLCRKGHHAQPRLDIEAWNAPRRIVKEEEPFHCVSCAKPFGVRSSIEPGHRQAEPAAALDVQRSRKGNRLRLLMMCEDCRVEAGGESRGWIRMPPRSAQGRAPPRIICASGLPGYLPSCEKSRGGRHACGVPWVASWLGRSASPADHARSRRASKRIRAAGRAC